MPKGDVFPLRDLFASSRLRVDQLRVANCRTALEYIQIEQPRETRSRVRGNDSYGCVGPFPLASRRPFSNGQTNAQLGSAVLPDDINQIDATVRAVLRDVLGLSEARVAGFRSETPLFGGLAELDSMAVAGMLTELEERLGILIEDDEVDGEMLETFGALVRFAGAKANR